MKKLEYIILISFMSMISNVNYQACSESPLENRCDHLNAENININMFPTF